jgi:ABC-type xylose transport system permease subunit
MKTYEVMPFVIDDWHDWWRVGIFLLSLLCLVILCERFRAHRQTWNTKTKDYWFTVFMWTVVGIVITLEGVYKNTGSRVWLVFVTAAVVVNLIGLKRKGVWGGDDDA